MSRILKFLMFTVAALYSKGAFADEALRVSKTPVAYLFHWVDSVIQGTFSNGVAHLVQIVSPIVGASLLLWSVIWAWKLVMEERDLKEIPWLIFTASIICFMSFGVNVYVGQIIPMVNAIPDDLSKAFMNSSTSPSSAADDAIYGNAKLIATLWSETDTIGWTGINLNNIKNLIAASLVITVMGSIYIALGVIILLVAKITINVVLALGPIFIPCAMFPATRSYFQQWLNQLVNYTLLACILSVLFSMELNMAVDLAKLSPEGNLADNQIGNMFFIYLVFLGTVASVPVLSSSLSGSMGINGALGNIMSTASTMASGAKGGAKMADKLISKLSEKGGSQEIGSNSISKNMSKPG